MNHVRFDGVTPLLMSCFKSDYSMIQLLLNRGAEIDYSNPHDGAMPLLVCCATGAIEIVMLLLENGANINCVDGNKNSALMVALMHGHQDIVNLLLDRGADVNASVSIDGTNPLILASEMEDAREFRRLIEKTTNIDRPDDKGETALFRASLCGRLDVVQMLLDRGANVNAERKDGVTPLMAAAKEGYTEIVTQLVIRGAGVNHVVHKHSALTLANMGGHKDVATFLLKAGANPKYSVSPGGCVCF